VPGGDGAARAAVVRGGGVAAEVVERGGDPVAQPARRAGALHVDGEVQQARLGVDVAVVAQVLVHAVHPTVVAVHVVFVCTGNICRSPIAEKVFVHELERAGTDGVRVGSAGTGDWHVGEPADPRAGGAAARRGLRRRPRRPPVRRAGRGPRRRAGPRARPRPARAGARPGPRAAAALLRPGRPRRRRRARPLLRRRRRFAEVLAMVRAAVPGLVDRVREHR
jgi:protein-tyrosine phosphatase